MNKPFNNHINNNVINNIYYRNNRKVICPYCNQEDIYLDLNTQADDGFNSSPCNNCNKWFHFDITGGVWVRTN